MHDRPRGKRDLITGVLYRRVGCFGARLFFVHAERRFGFTRFVRYRRKGTEELYAPDEAWRDTPVVARSAAGVYETTITGLKPELGYEFRAMVVHPLLTVFGEDQLVAGAKP